MPTVKAKMNAAAVMIMPLVVMESPQGFKLHVTCVAVYSTAACDGRHKLGEYGELANAAIVASRVAAYPCVD
jgi:hypothetical protein